MYLGGERPTRLNSINSKPILFPKVLCQDCNNSRSAPFDKAYDTFTELIWRNPEYFRDKPWLAWREVYESNALGPRNLCRYYVKNIGCRIAEVGFTVPPELLDFLDGAPVMPHATICLYTDYSMYDLFRHLGHDEQGSQYPNANRMFGPESPDEGPLEAFIAEIQDGPVGAIFWWDSRTPLGINFCSQDEVPIRHRADLPYQDLHQDQWDLAAQMTVALEQQGH